MNTEETRPVPITVAIIDDDINVCNGMSWLLNSTTEIHCLGAYASCGQALQGLVAQPPDVLLLDVGMPEFSGIDWIPVVREKLPSTKIIMHSNYDHEEKISRSMQAGALGYILKNGSASALFEAIRKVYQGDKVWPPGFEKSPTLPARPNAGFLKSITGKISKTLRTIYW